MKQAALASLIAIASTAAFAAQPVGTLSSASGAVSVGGQGVVTQAKAGVQLFDGATVMTPSGASATVSLAEGCTIVLRQNQHLTINNKLTCGQMQSSVKNLFQSYQVAQTGGLPPPPVIGGGFAFGSPLVVGGVIGGTALVGVTLSNNDANSP